MDTDNPYQVACLLSSSLDVRPWSFDSQPPLCNRTELPQRWEINAMKKPTELIENLHRGNTLAPAPAVHQCSSMRHFSQTFFLLPKETAATAPSALTLDRGHVGVIQTPFVAVQNTTS